jgi:hypothetical protein
MLYSFDDYTLDAEHYELRQAGRVVRLAPRVFNLVAYLALHATAGHHFNSQTPGACRPVRRSESHNSPPPPDPSRARGFSQELRHEGSGPPSTTYPVSNPAFDKRHSHGMLAL